MPQVNFLHVPEGLTLLSSKGKRHHVWSIGQIIELGLFVRPLVVELCSTKQTPLKLTEIDWVPRPYFAGTIVETPCSLELKTFGYDDRVAQIPEAAAEAFKKRILTHPLMEFFDPADPLLWICYQDGRGWHV